jgi:hypothetical protein
VATVGISVEQLVCNKDNPCNREWCTVAVSDRKAHMQIAVHCARCGLEIGMQAYVSYGKAGFEHIDYGSLEPVDYYGGEYDGEEYCDECYYDLTTAEEEEIV